MKVYLVTDNLHVDYEGDSTDLVGIYSSEKAAVAATKKYLSNDGIEILEEPKFEYGRAEIEYERGYYDDAWILIQEVEVDEGVD